MIGEAIRKPEWHGCPEFGRAWEAARRQMADPRARPEEVDACLDYARALGAARVVKASKNELLAVSKSTNGVVVWADDDHMFKLPFDPLFVSIDDGGHQVLVEEVPDGLQVTPCVIRDGEYRVGVGGVVSPAGKGQLRTEVRVWTLQAAQLRRDEQAQFEQIIEGATRSIRALLYLLRSANVDLAEPELPRGARRQVARKNQSVPLIIRVQRAKSRSAKRGGSTSYSHQFDRAGHFNHYFAVTRDGQPSKLFPIWAAKSPHKVLVVGGFPCIRTWIRPHVVGPEDAPYIPKVRDARGFTAV